MRVERRSAERAWKGLGIRGRQHCSDDGNGRGKRLHVIWREHARPLTREGPQALRDRRLGHARHGSRACPNPAGKAVGADDPVDVISRYLAMPIPSRSLISLALLAACELESAQRLTQLIWLGFAAREALA